MLSLTDLKHLIRDQALTIAQDIHTRYRHFGHMFISFYLEEVTFLDSELQNVLYYLITSNDFGSLFDFRYRWRLICSTTSNIATKIEAGSFSKRLHEELNRFSLDTTPLRHRTVDIPILALKFLADFSDRFQIPIDGISEAALQFLIQYSWPGNVAELKAALEKTCSHISVSDRIVKLEALMDLIQQSRMIDLQSEVG